MRYITYSDTAITDGNFTFVACPTGTLRWTPEANTYYQSGRVNPAATTLALCQSACFSDATCTGVDWFANSPQGAQCLRHGSWTGARGNQAGVTHYRLNRNCPDTSNNLILAI